MKRISILLAAFFAATAASGCSEKQNFQNGCSVDADCPTGSACRITGADAVGLCICRSDEACGPGEECNSQGVCQTRSGCRTTADCADEPNTYCDVGSGDCIALTACGSLVHCDPGFVCDPTTDACVAGCYGHGDCPLYAACTVTSPDQGLGACLSGTCGDKSFCPYGHLCTNGACMPHPNQNNCLPCGGVQQCPSADDFCLTNNQYDPARPETGSEAFCSIQCTDDNSCPNGYGCNTIVVPTQNECTRNEDCNPGSECRLGEAALRGWCTCQSDVECSPNELPPRCQKSCSGLGIQACNDDSECVFNCESSCLSPAGQACSDDSQCQPTPLCDGGRCITTGAACSQGRDCLCNANGRCINSGRQCSTAADCTLTCQQGGCLIGAGCAPEEGLLCPELR